MQTKCSPLPLGIGVLLWIAATAMLLEESWHLQRFDVATLSVPILTAGTVASACLAHLRFASFRLLGGLGFLVLAVLGSTIMATGTLGRIAEAKDSKQAGIYAATRTFGLKQDELKAAKAEAARECKSLGSKCLSWQARIDTLTKELSAINVRSSDPKADAIARLATVIGGPGEKVKEIVAAFDPVLIPLFLELGSVGFFASAFHRNRRPIVSVDAKPAETPTQPSTVLSQGDALRDFRSMKHVGGQHILAQRWGVDRSTVSRWLRAWEDAGHIDRNRIGKAKVVLALPAPSTRNAGQAGRAVQ
jgi:hypothetical protein